ncbi:Gfo/Idh/MocA family oxidoreductase [Oscillospiraceae bacterium OttesenSCG-928-F05]|nr:Gfo/Idh/MocA family oxidoreductase [Oscillospiraceae bacterium OttesenSCG-928-F05]
MASKVKIGIVGTGTISNEHIAAYKKNPDVELYAFCDVNADRLNQMGKTYGVSRLFTDLDAMLALPELDAVSICVWNSEHAPCAIKALKAGKHVLCEKPMARTVAEAEEMLRVSKEMNKLLMIGFVRRFGEDCNVIKSFIDSDKLGDIYYAKVRCLRRKGNPGGWFGEKARSGGGPLIDLGVHLIDFVKYVTGKPEPVSVYGATFNKLGARGNTKDPLDYIAASATDHDICDVEDMATALIRFDNGLVLSVEASYSLNVKEGGRQSIEIFGSKGGLRLAPNLEYFSEMNGYMTNTELFSPVAFTMESIFTNEINHFVDCIKGRAECLNPPEDGVSLMRILCSVYESAASGHEVCI